MSRNNENATYAQSCPPCFEVGCIRRPSQSSRCDVSGITVFAMYRILEWKLTFKTLALFQAGNLQDSGVTVIAVAMSPNGEYSSAMRLELETIAADPDEENFLEAPFQDLYTLLPQITGGIIW